jgi:anthranilate phosphoribosyltransferase
MSATVHRDTVTKNTLCIAATGGESRIRTLYVTIPVGIICSLHLPTVVQGNRAVTGCGCGGWAESDMMEFFKYPLFLSREKGEEILAKTKFFYAHAQSYHPILRRFSRERGIIGFRDIFKISTGLSDPFRCEYQYLCVWKNELAELSANVLSEMDHITKAVITSGEMSGIDELPVTGGTFYCATKHEVSREFIKTDLVDGSEDMIGPERNLEDESNLIQKILDPSNSDKNITSKRDLITVNAALALSAAMDIDFAELMNMVKKDIADGNALRKFEEIKSNAVLI